MFLRRIIRHISFGNSIVAGLQIRFRLFSRFASHIEPGTKILATSAPSSGGKLKFILIFYGINSAKENSPGLKNIFNDRNRLRTKVLSDLYYILFYEFLQEFSAIARTEHLL